MLTRNRGQKGFHAQEPHRVLLSFIIGSQHHQPSGSNWSGVSVLVGSIQVTSPTWWRFQYLQNSSKILLCISLGGGGLPGPCPKAALSFLDCPSLVSTSLISKCLNLPFGTQERSWRLNEAYFPQTRNGGHRKPFVPRSPTVSNSVRDKW